MQDAALVAMRSEVNAEVTKLRSRELEQAQQELRQQLQQQVHTSFSTLQQSHIQTTTYHAECGSVHVHARDRCQQDSCCCSQQVLLAILLLSAHVCCPTQLSGVLLQHHS